LDPRGFLTTNLGLDLAITAWLLAQVIKVVVDFALQKRFDFRLLASSGGMPSSHSAFVCALAASIAVLNGIRSSYFALAAALSVIVMYDACNVRRAAGEQAKILNYIIDHWNEMSPSLMGKELKELLGHTPLQVIVGAILGIMVGGLGAVLLG